MSNLSALVQPATGLEKWFYDSEKLNVSTGGVQVKIPGSNDYGSARLTVDTQTGQVGIAGQNGNITYFDLHYRESVSLDSVNAASSSENTQSLRGS